MTEENKSISKKELKKRKLNWAKIPFWLALITLVVATGGYLSYRYLVNPDAFAAVVPPPEITSLKDIQDKDTGKWEVEITYPSKGDAIPPNESTIAELYRSDKPDSGYIFIMEAPMWGFPKSEGIKIYDQTEQLIEGRTYYYKFVLKGVSSEAKSIKVGETLSEIPAPKNLTAVAGDKTVSLTWEAGNKTKSISEATKKVSDDKTYNIYRGTKTNQSESIKTDGGKSAAIPEKEAGINYILTTKTPVKGYSHTDSDLTNGTTYYYYVTEVKAKKESNPSNKVSAIPNEEGKISAPTGLTAKSNWYSVTLSWNQVKDATSYKVYYGEKSNDYKDPIEIKNVAKKDQKLTYDLGINKINYGTYYYFTVTALKESQESAKPDPVYERSLIPGDLNQDQKVNTSDFAVWITLWLQFEEGGPIIDSLNLEGDFNSDSKVDLQDFAIWNTYWLNYEKESSIITPKESIE
ncbi:fibronectin type III domain-containing protein [Patescibacteria group bacterium]